MAEDAESTKTELKNEAVENNESSEQRSPEEIHKAADEKTPPVEATVSEEKNEEEKESAQQENSEEPENSADLDDDQQVENPAYIPKVGKFYMHDDDRRGEEIQDNLDSEEGNDQKKSRADGLWKHDRFDEKFQRPKSKKQIVKKYGCDIRSDQKDGDASAEKETTAPESTEDDSDVKQVQKNQKDRRVVARPSRGRTAPTNRRRPMRQREREDTVDESNTEVEERPAQRRTASNNNSKPRQQISRSSEEDDEDAEIQKGQRRNQGSKNVGHVKRGFSGTARLRGRVTQAPSRRPSSRPDEQDGESARPHHQQPSIPVRRFRGGVSRGGFSSRGVSQHIDNNRRGSPRTTRDYNSGNSARQVNDDRFENHRRGVIRGGSFARGGGAVRGTSSTVTHRGGRGANNASRGGFVSRTDTSEQSDGYQRDFPPPTPARGSFRGGSYNSAPRGGSQSFQPRGGYTNGNDRGGYNNNHHHQPHHHQQQHHHHQGPKNFGPPPMQTIVVPTNVPPPQMTRGTTHSAGVVPQQQQRIRQPTDVVYFDPVQQQVNRAPVQSRVKKVIPIVDPNTKK